MDRDKAFIGFTQVVQVDPTYAPAWFNLGVLGEAAGRWTDARSYFQRYLVLAPKGPYAQRAQRELTIIAQRIAHPIPTKQQQCDAIIGRAQALAGGKFYKEAIDEAGQAQSLDDSRWEAYALVSVIMYKQHKDIDGKKFRDLALAHLPPDKKVLVASFDASTLINDFRP